MVTRFRIQLEIPEMSRVQNSANCLTLTAIPNPFRLLHKKKQKNKLHKVKKNCSMASKVISSHAGKKFLISSC